MARQKPSVQAVKRNEPTWQEVSASPADLRSEDKEVAGPTSPSATESDDEFETETEYEEKAPEDLLSEGKQIRRKDLERAIKLFDVALRLKIKRDNLEQTAPQLAEYWLSYGDALYTKEEESSELFHPQSEGRAKDTPMEDDKETAWQCLDLARLGFESMLSRLKETGELRPVEIEDLWDAINAYQTSGQLWKPLQLNQEVKHLIEDAIFTRLRLGDCNQAEAQFDRAIEDFSESLRLCMMYQVSHERTLEPTIPLCHCLLAINHEHTEKAFAFAISLIDSELSTKQDMDETRRETLKTTKEDLQAQVKEYIEHHEEVKREAREAILSLMSSQEVMKDGTIGFGVSHEAEASNSAGGDNTIDLGVVGRKRKKPEDTSTRAPTSEAITAPTDEAAH